MLYVKKWRELLEPDYGKQFIPNWQWHLNETTKYIDIGSFNINSATEKDNEEICEEWMCLTKLVELEKENSSNSVDSAYNDNLGMNYSNQWAIQSIPFWLEQEKGVAM